MIDRGDYVTIVGPSGSGKSTLLNMVGLLDRPTTGRYILDGYDTQTFTERDRTALRARRIGFVFQSFHLLDHRSATENVALGMLYTGSHVQERTRRAREALDRVGLNHRRDAFPSALSGGEKQRVAIARAVAGRPQVLLCDEPTGNLDSEHVAVLGTAAARQLGIGDLSLQPAVFVDGMPFLIVGIIDDLQRQANLLFAVVIPSRTVEATWGPPRTADGRSKKMLIDTRLGAAQVVAQQVAVALRPDAPSSFNVNAPPDPRTLREAVATDLAGLFLVLAGICLVIGAVSIANTTLVSVMERVHEIGLRRALGARRRHIAIQFLAEAGAIGAAGGIVGTALAVVAIVIIALVQRWTPILSPSLVLPSPLVGALIGVLAGAYPARRAAAVEPAEALRK